MDGHETAFLTIAETHAQYGTTAMLPTTLTIPALMAAGFLYCIVPGSSKATASDHAPNDHLSGAQLLM